MPSLRLMVVITAQPGLGAMQVAAFRQLAPLVRVEEGCLQYELYPVLDDPDRFVLLEHWASREALAQHDKAPHMQKAAETNKAFRAGPAQVVLTEANPVSS